MGISGVRTLNRRASIEFPPPIEVGQ